MDHSKPEYLTPQGFSRSKKGTGLNYRLRVKKPVNIPAPPAKSPAQSPYAFPPEILSKFERPRKPFQLSEEAARQIARVISQMLKNK